jgi:hypothetical protein
VPILCGHFWFLRVLTEYLGYTEKLNKFRALTGHKLPQGRVISSAACTELKFRYVHVCFFNQGSVMRREKEFNNFLKERFLRNIEGFSLAEIMVAAGILGMISLGVMQMTQNLQKNQKKFQYDAEINEFLTRLQMGLRDKTACERTFIGADEPANPGVPLQPITVHADAQGTYQASAALVNAIYGGGENGAGNATVLAQVGQRYGAVGGGFQVVEIKLHSAQVPAAMNELVPARVGIKLRKLGAVDDQGDADPSNDILKGAWGPAEVVKNFDILVTVWDAADPNLAPAGGVAGNLRSCFVSEDYYVNAACKALGGELDTDGACKNLAIGKLTETYPADTLNAESVNWEFLVEGNTRLKNNVEVGYDNGNETDPNATNYIEPLTFPTDYQNQGNILVENNILLGFNKSGGANDVPRMTDSGDYQPGTLLGTGNLFMGYGDPALPNPNLTNAQSGNIIARSSVYAGFPSGTNLTAVSDGVGGAGEIVAQKGITVNDNLATPNTGYGIDIKDGGTANNQFLLRVGDDSGFIDVDIPRTLRFAGNNGGNGGTAVGEAHLRIGPNNQRAQISGTSVGIGINTPAPARQFHVTGDTQMNGDQFVMGNITVGDSNNGSSDKDLTVYGNAHVLGYLKLSTPTSNQGSFSGETFDTFAATVGWVRQRIANTLAPDASTRTQIAGDILNTTFNEAGSALRVIQQNYCTRLQIYTGYSSTSWSGPVSGSWSGGRCRYYVRNCGYNNHCNYVYANTGIISDGYVRATRYVWARDYVSTNGHMYATSYIRGRSYLYVDSYARASRFCIGGSSSLSCITRIPNTDCGWSNKVRGIHNGYVQCAWDIRP